MAGKSATLSIKIVSDASGAKAGLEEAESRVGKFSSGLDKASVAAGGVLGGLALIGKEAFDAASELQQAGGAMDATFGASAASMRGLADEAANSFGLSKASYSQMASVIGSQLKNMGVAQDELQPHTNALVARGADLAAQFGGSTSDAVEALSSLLRGERDPIERYGVSVSQAGVDAKVAALGLDTSTEAAKKNAQYMATLAIVSEQTRAANGAFAREADTAAGAQQRATAQFENAKATLGEALLPVVADAMTKFSGLTTFLVENKDAVQLGAIAIGGLATAVLAINAGLKTFRAIQTAVTAAQWLWNAAATANPIGAIVIILVALVAGFVLAYQKVGWFRDAVNAAGRIMASAFDGFKAVLSWIWEKLSSVIGLAKKAGSFIGGLFGAPAAPPAPGTGGAGGGGSTFRGAGSGGSYAAASGVSALRTMAATAPTTVVQGVSGPPIVLRLEHVDPVRYASQLRSQLSGLDVAQGRRVVVEL